MARLITGFGPRTGPSPTGENVVARNPRWGCCLYCFLEHEREVELSVSPIIGGGVKCTGCGRWWRDAATYNADIKELMERVVRECPWVMERPTKEEATEQAAWDKEMDENIRKHKASLPKKWTPYINPDDAPIVLGVDGRKDGDDESGDATDDAGSGRDGSVRTGGTAGTGGPADSKRPVGDPDTHSTRHAGGDDSTDA